MRLVRGFENSDEVFFPLQMCTLSDFQKKVVAGDIFSAGLARRTRFLTGKNGFVAEFKW
jgi:hypothetical protein